MSTRPSSEAAPGAAKRAFHGGCHCGALRFKAQLDLSAGTVKCNCSYCEKSRFWHARAVPEDFSVSGEASEYRGRNPVARHFFCPDCGVHVHDRVETPNMLGRPYINVSVVCLEDVDVAELIAAPVRYCDGLNNAWVSVPAETRHL
jgi:hypothetical protein